MDSIGRIVSSVQNAARSLDIEVPDAESAKSIIGLSLPKAIATLFDDVDESLHPELVKRYSQQYVQLDTTPTPMFECAEELLIKLKNAGCLLAVATGKSRAGLNRVFNSTGLAHLFDASICADESQSKPHPAMLETLLTKLDVSKQQTVMIGDTVHDLQMALNAGIDSIGVTCGVNDAATLTKLSPIAVADDMRALSSVLFR
ncbi:HAD family hydrolase [Catenovulum agarivorans DS-2]|uniref:HAD family hydrolase n=2 Tax=Catenovulum agarivorans TaxID=1172192 RepID=W7QP91_9ALTE|nr:HAD family hydrolase [Catenovulum agarivorans DS-2]